MDFKIAALLAVLIAGTYAGPVKQNLNLLGQTQCARQCTGKSKFNYQEGQVYVYTYEAETKTGVHGASDEQAGLKIQTTAEIEILSKCELALTLTNSAVFGSDPNIQNRFVQDTQTAKFQQELEQYPLRFSFQDGIVEELCPTLEESSWALNVKRGILSAFQNSMDSFKQEQNLVEVDVIGKCRTDYKIAQEGWRMRTLKKSKDMLSCTDRHGYESSIHSALYNVPANIRSLPILKSTQECDQEVSLDQDGHVTNVECHEMHLFRPFSQGNSGAMTEVTQRLKFVAKKIGGATRMAEVTKRSSILFEHTMGEKQETINNQAAQDKLTELCQTTEDGVQFSTPRLFSELVYLLKKVNVNGLDALFKEVSKSTFCPKNSERAKKFYLDALPMVGTGAAIRQITELISNKDVTGKFVDAWLTAITFIQHPTKDMLSEMTKLLSTNIASQVLLSLSTLTSTYCKANPTCESEREVIAVLDKLQGNLGMDCSGADQTLTLLTLRAIGNIEQSQRFVPTLENCFGHKQNSMEIRVAAVEAYRRMSCGADRNNLMAIFRNEREDSELRIMAYLQVMKCPSDYTIQQVKDTLKAEDVNQVGSFVWTHLTNLMKTSSPLKQAIKAVLEDQALPKKFDMDLRKFSRNYDWSYFSEDMNAGGSMESNLVWSTESFLPRSVMGNLTVDMFGRSVNLLEVGGRVEGLDYLLESYFGPSGSLNDGTLSPKENSNKALKMKKLNKIDNSFDKKVQELKGAMYMRVFGNEVVYQKLDSQSNVPGKGFNLLEMFMSLKKDHDITYSKSSMFLDSSIIVPTVIGLPLNLTLNGTLSVDLKAKGKMDLGKPAKVILIEGELFPSGAVEFSSIMSVDAFYTKSGMKMTSTLHTRTGMSGKIQIKEKDDITVQFNVPQKKSEILNVKSSFFTIYKNQEREQKMLATKQIKKKFCSGYTMAKITGLELCGEMSFVNASDLPHAPHFPLTGPVSIRYEVIKQDTHVGYRFQLKKINNRKQLNYKIFYETPGGKVERATGFELSVQKRDKTMLLQMVSPWKKARFNGNLVNNKAIKKFSGIATVDDTREYRLVGEMKRQEKKGIIKYNTTLSVMYPDRSPIFISGLMEYAKKKSFSANINMKGVTKDPMSLQAMVKYTDKVKGGTFKFMYEKNKVYSVIAMMRTDISKTRLILRPKIDIATPQKQLLSFSGQVDYKLQKSVKVDLKLSKALKSDLSLKGNFVWNIKPTRSVYKARANFRGLQSYVRVRFNLDKKAKKITTSFRTDYNFARLVKKAKDSVTFTSKITNKSTKPYKNINVVTNFKSARFADYNNQLVMNVDHRLNKVGDIDVVFDYGKNYLDKKLNKKKIDIHVATKYNIKKSTANIQYNITARYAAMNVDALVTGKHYHTKKNVKSGFTVQYENKKKLNFGIKFSDESRKFPKYTGGLNVMYEGRDISVSGLATKKGGLYNGKLNVQHQKGQQSVFVGSFKFPSNTSVQADSNIRVNGQKPLTVSVSGDYSIQSPKAVVDVTYGQEKYKVQTELEYTAYRYGRLLTEFTHPNRSIKMEAEGGDKKGKYIGKVDVSWDANKDVDKRVLLEVASRFIDVKDFDGYFITQIPGRQILANVRNDMKNSVDSSIELSWSPKDKLSAMIQFVNNRRRYKGETKIAVGFTTPFKNLEEYKAIIGNSYNRKSMESMISITYAKMKTVSATAITQTPLAINDFNMELLIKTPFAAVGNPVVKISQTLSSNNMKHFAKVSTTWGKKQFVNLETNGIMQPYRRSRREFSRNIGFTSSFLGYESVIVNITHSDNLQKFESKANINHNGVIYNYKVDITHFFNKWEIDHTGTLQITSPYDTMNLVWSHKNSRKDLRSSAIINWGNGERFSAVLEGDIAETPNRRYTSRLEMHIPSQTVQRVDLTFEHEDKVGYIKTIASLKADRKNIGTAKIDYQRQLGSADFDFGLTSIYMNDFKIAVSGKHAIMPMTGLLEIEWAPGQKIVIDSKYSLIDKSLDSMLRLSTPFPRVNNVVFKAIHKLNGFSWDAEMSIEYAPYQKISLGSTYRLDDIEKAVRVFVSTPFPQFQRLETGARFNGNGQKFDSNADFKIIPLVGDVKAAASWKTGRRSVGKISLNTPYRSYPGFKAEIDSVMTIYDRKTTAMVEYLPGQKIEVIGKHSMKKDALDGEFTLVTPFSYPIHVAYRQNGNVNAFSNHADVRYSYNQSIVIDTTFGMQPKIYGTYSMVSPIKGYEEVQFAFSHEGQQWKDFRTQLEYGTDGNKIEIETMLNIVRNYQGKIMLKTPFPNMAIRQIAFSHEGNALNFKSRGELVSDQKTIEGNAVFSHALQDTMGTFTLKTPFREAKLVQVAFNKQGNPTNFRSHGEATYNSRKYETDVIFSHDSALTSGTVTLKSPVKGWEETVLTFNRDGQMNKFKANGELRYSDKMMSGSLTHDFNRDDVSTIASLTTPFTDKMDFKLMQNTRPKGFTTDVEFSMGSDNMMKTHTLYKFRKGNLKFESDVTVVMTGERNTASVSAEHKGVLTDFTCKADATLNSEKVGANIQYRGNKWENVDIAAKLELPVQNYEQLEFIMKNQKLKTSYKMDVDVQYATGKKITTKSTINPMNDMSVVVTTPFHGYKTMNILCAKQQSGDVYTGEFKIEAEGKQLAKAMSSINLATYLGEIRMMKEDKTVFLMDYDKQQKRRQLRTEVHMNDTTKIYLESGCEVKLPFMDCNLRLLTPFSEELSVVLKNADEGTHFVGEITGTYGSKVMSLTGRGTGYPTHIDGSVKFTSPFTEVLTVALNSTLPKMKSMIEFDASYGLSNVNYKSDISSDNKAIYMAFKVNSPHTKDLSLTLRNNLDGQSLMTEASGNYGSKKLKYGSRLIIKLADIDARLNLTSSFTEDMSVVFSHKKTGNTLRTNLRAIHGDEIINSYYLLTLGSPDFSTEFSLMSPFTEDLKIEVSNVKNQNTYVTKSLVTYGAVTKTASSTVTINLPLLDVNIKSNAILSYRNNEIDFKHSGNWNDMRCTVSVSSDNMVPITMVTRFRYDGPWDMEAAADFASGIQGMRKLGGIVNNQMKGKTYVTHMEIILDPARQIVLDNEYEMNLKDEYARVYDDRYRLILTTPFEKLKSLKYIASSTKRLTSAKSTEYLEYNGEALYDHTAIMNFDKNAKYYSFQSEFKAPRNMEYTMSVATSWKEGSLSLNWDKLNPNSNLQINYNASLINQHGKYLVNVVHPKLAIKMEKELRIAMPAVLSKFMFTMENGKKSTVGYILDVNSNKRYLKVVTPMRSVEGQHTFNSNFDEVQVSWDADGDKNKMVAVKVIEGTAAQIDKTVEIELPNFRKSYSIHTKLNKANNRWDGTTELSYSGKRRKNIVLSAQIVDASHGSTKNTTWTVGISQPFTKLDISLSGHCGENNNKKTVGFGVEYLTDKRQKTNLLLLGEIDKLKKQIDLNVFGPRKSFGVQGRVVSERPYKVVLSSMTDGVKNEGITATLDEQKKMVLLKVKYDKGNPNKALYLMGQYPTYRDIEAQVYHADGSSQITDSLLNVQLKSSRILHTKLHWRPEMFAELLEYVSQTLQTHGQEVNSMFLEVGTEMAQEFARKDSAFSKEIVNELRPFADAIAEQMKGLRQEMRSLKTNLNLMYQNNELYLRDINDAYSNVTKNFILRLNQMTVEMQKTYRDMSAKIKDISNEIRAYPFQEKYSEVVNRMSQKMEEYQQEAVSMMRQEVSVITDKVRRNIQELQAKIQKLAQQVRKMASDKLDAVLLHPDVQDMKQQMKNLINNIPVDIDFNSYVDKVHTAVKSALKSTNLQQNYNSAVNKVQSVVNKHYDDLAKDIDFQQFKKLMNEIYQEMLLQYQYLELRNSIQGMMKGMMKDTQKFITEDIAQMKIIGWHKSRIIEFDPVNGNIEVDIYIPTAMETLEKLPKLPVHKMKKLVRDVKEIVDSLIPDKDFSPWDVYYRYKPRSLNPIDWIPPFKAHGIIAGGRHYVTFDGKVYDFSGSCSFVLTRDLVNQNFTVIVNYDKTGQKMESLLVFTEGQNIEISNGFVIKVNERPHELPYSHHKLSVERMGNWIKLDTGRGLVITGDAINNHYVIEVSGWYFGKLAGLLGTYNNEQYDELTTGNAALETDLGEFSKSWEVSKSCRPKGNQASPILKDPANTMYQKCSELFESQSSTFRPCFKQVEPSIFMSLCLYSGDVCSTSSAYISSCKMAGVTLYRQKECVECSAPNDEKFLGGEKIKVSPGNADYQVLNSVDTVIVVEEKKCNERVAKELGDLVYEIEKSLTRKGMTNNRYGLVGYSRSGPHSHTMEGQVLNDATKFNKGVESLKFSSYNTDPLKAIMHSINYPFRSGVAKNIILLQCGRCSDSKSLTYSKVRGLLDARDIKLHILRDQEFKVGNRSPKQKILGVDNTRKYVLNNLKDNALDELLTPVDTCTHLALITNGSIFDSSSIMAKKIRDRKFFLRTVSSRVAKSSEAHECQVCKCEADETGAAHTVCRKCFSEISDYLPYWFSNIKHPMAIKNQFQSDLNDYLNTDKAMAILSA